MADLHSGHRVGLTPPRWHRPELANSDNPQAKFLKVQIELWYEFQKIVSELQPIDILFVNGDAIDGRGERSGGTELLTTSQAEQILIAKDCIREVGAKQIVMTYGTPYHTSNAGEDWEKELADDLGALKIGGQEWVDVNGVIFDLKHKIGSTTIPHGKGTPLAKERLWNVLWNEYEEQPKSDVIIRSHVHYAFACTEPGWLAMTTPALQGQGSKYGSRICQGIVHWGLTHFDVFDDGAFSWAFHIVRVQSQKAKILRL